MYVFMFGDVVLIKMSQVNYYYNNFNFACYY